MNDLIPLHFDGKSVRYFIIAGDPWWVLTDVCKTLGRGNPAKMALVLDADERYTLKVDRGGELILVSEPGLMKIIMRSDNAIKPGTFAHGFVRWVTHEVLPTIRKHGRYPAPPEPESLPLPDPHQGDEFSSPVTRFMDELRRISGLEKRAEIIKRFENVISSHRFAQLDNGDGLLKAMRFEDTWRTMSGAGVDFSYVFENYWKFTPFERDLIDHVRALPPQQQAQLLHAVTQQASALQLADDSDEPYLLN